MPVGLVIALLVGLVLPAPGAALGSVQVGPIDATVFNVVLIFFLSGFTIHGANVDTTGFGRAIAFVLTINLIAAPLLVAGVLWALPIGLAVALGLAVMGSVPTTLSSAAVTAGVAGGDRAWAAALTVVCVSAGAVTAPIAVSLILSSDTSVPPGPLLIRVFLIVIVPLVVGFAVARLTGHQLAPFWELVPSLAVIALLWITVSESAESLVEYQPPRLAAVIGIVLGIHLLLLFAGWLAGRQFSAAQGVSVAFVLAQKTLPLALSLLVAVAAVSPDIEPYVAEAVIVCVVWHFLQLLVDSAVAARVAKMMPRTAS